MKKWEKYLATGEHKASDAGEHGEDEHGGGEPMEEWTMLPKEARTHSTSSSSSIEVANPEQKRTTITRKQDKTPTTTTTTTTTSSSESSITTAEKLPTSKPATTQKPESGDKDIIEKFGTKLIRVVKTAADNGKLPLHDAVGASDALKIDEFLQRSLSITANPVVSRKKRGDYSTNIALRIAGQKSWRDKHPSLPALEVAKIIVEQFSLCLENDPLPSERWRAEVSQTPPGFINLIDLQLGDVHLAREHKSKEKKAEKKQKKTATDSPAETATKRMKIDVNPKHKFEIQTVRSAFDKECFDVYVKYQMKIHGDKPGKNTEESYTNFLIKSPLMYEPQREGVPPCGFGSFHQIYRLDGRVVAVGVVDILPSCLSGVYFYYDPDLQFLSLGKVSAMKEIEWVHSNQKYSMNMHYYYMGYYIHTCQKMRYKGTYRPSDLLCPQTHEWVPLNDQTVALIEGQKNARLVQDPTVPTATEKINSKKSDIFTRLPILYRDRLFFLGDLTESSRRTIATKLSTYVDRVGLLATRTMCMLT
eukprot:TRINITY_DN4454_c0_g1_i1.p1 TRINITY_DN4454_c0_g1~~TRINITY_DN4454_c0_g1_i1.p1  ORF type:complete len:539 (+),score=109.43 TRINITY_DN4454_c0_g1_i1:22-1617(+)